MENEYIFSELVFKNITIEDEAEYQCIVRNKHSSSYSTHSVIQVQEIPRFVLSPPEEFAVVSGSTVSLPCKATGIPEPTIGFQKDGVSVFDAVREKRVYVPDTEDTLYILRVNKTDQGVYSCTAINEAGKAVVSSKLLVFGLLIIAFYKG